MSVISPKGGKIMSATIVKNPYEAIFVIDISLGEDKVKELVEKFTTLISDNSDNVTVDEWGRRRTAYSINDQNEAYYVLVNFEAPAAFPLELERIYKITEGIVRFITVRRDRH